MNNVQYVEQTTQDALRHLQLIFFLSKKTTGSLRSSSFFYFQTVSDFINEINDLEDNFYSPQVHLFI